MSSILLYIASTMIALWGIAHLLATRGVVTGFGDITMENKHIITMEWIIEGVALISTATFVVFATVIQQDNAVSNAVYLIAIVTLIILALISLFTGFRIAFLPFRLCPFVLGISAVLIAAGAWWV